MSYSTSLLYALIFENDVGTLSSRGKSKATRPAEDTEATQQEARDTAGAAEPELVDGAAGMDNKACSTLIHAQPFPGPNLTENIATTL